MCYGTAVLPTSNRSKRNLPDRRNWRTPPCRRCSTFFIVKRRYGKRLRGRAYDYAAVLTREKVASNAIGDMMDRLFGGSVDGLLMSLVKNEQLDPTKLQELSGLVEEHERGKEGKGQ